MPMVIDFINNGVHDCFDGTTITLLQKSLAMSLQVCPSFSQFVFEFQLMHVLDDETVTTSTWARKCLVDMSPSYMYSVRDKE